MNIDLLYKTVTERIARLEGELENASLVEASGILYALQELRGLMADILIQCSTVSK